MKYHLGKIRDFMVVNCYLAREALNMVEKAIYLWSSDRFAEVKCFKFDQKWFFIRGSICNLRLGSDEFSSKFYYSMISVG